MANEEQINYKKCPVCGAKDYDDCTCCFFDIKKKINPVIDLQVHHIKFGWRKYLIQKGGEDQC